MQGPQSCQGAVDIEDVDQRGDGDDFLLQFRSRSTGTQFGQQGFCRPQIITEGVGKTALQVTQRPDRKRLALNGDGVVPLVLGERIDIVQYLLQQHTQCL